MEVWKMKRILLNLAAYLTSSAPAAIPEEYAFDFVRTGGADGVAIAGNAC